MSTTAMDRDQEYEETTIQKVRRSGKGWEITRGDGWCFYVPDRGIVPHRGDTARFYGQGIGRPVRGLCINGKKVFYRTVKQEAAKHRRWCEALDRKRRREFEGNRADMDARYAALPDVFRRRLDRFRAGNPDFRWNHEGYELFTCEEAVKIATALVSAEEVTSFSKLNWDAQQRRIPDLSDGHSGNTFGAACRLAWLYLTHPELVSQEHGALTPLVGCDEYGCTHEAV